MLRLPAILTALIAMGGLAATTQTPRTDAEKQVATESTGDFPTVDAPTTDTQNTGTNTQLAAPLTTQSSNQVSGGSNYTSWGVTEYVYMGREWFRKHFSFKAEERAMERAREEARLEREIASIRRENSVRREEMLHHEDFFNRGELHRSESFHREDPFHRDDHRFASASFHRDEHRAEPFEHHADPFHPGTEHHVDPFHPVAEHHEDPFHPQHASGYQSPLNQPSRSSSPFSRPAGSTGGNGGVQQVHRSAPVVQRVAPQVITH